MLIFKGKCLGLIFPGQVPRIKKFKLRDVLHICEISLTCGLLPWGWGFQLDHTSASPFNWMWPFYVSFSERVVLGVTGDLMCPREEVKSGLSYAAILQVQFL